MADTKTRGRRLPRRAALTGILLLVIGLVFSGFSLSLGGDQVQWGPVLFALNTLPVLLCLAFLWLVTGWAWLSCAVTGTLLFLLTGANYFLLIYRSTPMLWSTLFNVREGFQIAKQYDTTFTPLMWAFIGFIAAATVVLLLIGRGRPGALGRLLGVTAAGMLLLGTFQFLYPDDDLYTSLAGDAAKDETSAYMACGVVYPFLHSAGDYYASSATYDERAVRAYYNQYQDAAIPADRKVDLVGIQLEAFADLTLFDIEGISPDVYRDFHELQARSISGTLVTDVFAGGTAETEWAVLTGGNQHGDFKQKTDSVAWYLKGQGYATSGGHPSHEWFYGRVTANRSLGFDEYLFMENYYNRYSDEDVCYDDVFFPDLQRRLSDHFATENAPLFSFNVTYQGHGPYNTEQTYWGESFCTGDYDTDIRYALNNYLYLMQDTSQRLLALTEWLDGLDRPVVLFLYGDHKPWMGSQGSFYERLGISLDTTTEQGFLNYYTTWYVIWANQSAKAVLGNDFVGEGPMLSACFLMDEVFQQCGWTGSAYMQAQRPVAEALPVLHTTGWCEEGGVLTHEPSEAAQRLIDQFQNVSLYDRTR